MLFALIMSVMMLNLGCESSSNSRQEEHPLTQTEEKQQKLSSLNIKEQAADIALPFCEHKNCIEIHIQTIQTQEQWMNDWISKNQANVIQGLIGLKQNMTLQQAVNAFIKQSDVWQTEDESHVAYELTMFTRMAYQRRQFVLLKLSVDVKQQLMHEKELDYFFVADRKQKKTLSLPAIINKNQQVELNDIVQKAYQEWLTKQAEDIQQQAPKKLSWRQADWFFDQEGIALHYRNNEIVNQAKGLDIYLTKLQTQKVLNAEIYSQMF